MGGKSQPAPNYNALAAASREAAQTMGQLGNRQLAFAQQQYEELSPLLRGIATTQQQAQQEQMRQARDYYDYMQSTYRPIERQLAAEAERFNEAQYREQLASQAAADAGRAFSQVQAAQQRGLASMGINPASGRFASMQNQAGLGLAAQRAAAMTGTRQQAQQLGYARRLDVAGLGRGLPGASTAAYGGATGAGTAAGNMYMAPGDQYMRGMGQGAQTIGTGLGQQISGYGTLVNAQQSGFNAGLNAQAEVTGALVGAGGAAATRFSDRRIKKNIHFVGTHGPTGLPLYEFEYRFLPGARYIGVMADDVEKRYPDAVVETKYGIKAVNYEVLGIEMLEV